MTNFDLKNYLTNNKLLTESLKEYSSDNLDKDDVEDDEFKTFDEVKIGDEAFVIDMDETDPAGKIIWKGTSEELKKSKYIKILDGLDDIDFYDGYNLVIVNIEGNGPQLFNYDEDEDGVVAYKDNNSLNEESDQLNSQSTISLPELAEELIEQITNGASHSDVIQILADYLK